MDLKAYTRLKDKIDDLQRRADRAQGLLEGILGSLNKEFQCTSLEQAECLLHNERQELEQIKQELDEAVEVFWNKYGDRLEKV